MINLKLLETNYDEFVKKLEGKNVKASLLDELLHTFNELKQKRKALENFQAIQNAKSKELGVKARAGEDVSELKSELNLNKAAMLMPMRSLNNMKKSLSKFHLACQISPTMTCHLARTRTIMFVLRRCLSQLNLTLSQRSTGS